MNRKNPPGILLIGRPSLPFAHSTRDHVEIVYDGDTIILETGKKVRSLGIGAPEAGYEGNRSEFLAIASKNFNFCLVYKKSENGWLWKKS